VTRKVANPRSDANPWIFAVAAGMFVYIALVDMVPEVAALREELLDRGLPYPLVLCIQHAGLLSGFMLMLMMALYGDQIAG
jgi:zinc transporter ZupT